MAILSFFSPLLLPLALLLLVMPTGFELGALRQEADERAQVAAGLLFEHPRRWPPFQQQRWPRPAEVTDHG
ncbi:hypothetical protein KFK09_019738 [Dendrobium nobile]|uniref:Uncharacterized protein n=1 Tax=Dendrobium nobile TaxID=94219 RepID=A0A8T3AT21_DENNO|nr:hypothetical protein KFK09_019738 [Dendrobium nobile]